MPNTQRGNFFQAEQPVTVQQSTPLPVTLASGGDVTAVSNDVDALDTRVTTAESNISTNTSDIATNTSDVASAKGVTDQLLALSNYADDTAAAAGGVGVGEFYRNGSVVMIRVA